MNWVDISLIVIMAGFVAKGVIQGMMRQLIGLLSILASLLLAIRYSQSFSYKLAAIPALRPTALPMAFAMIALGIWALLNLFGILWYKHARQEDDDHWLDDVAGGVVGFATGAVLLSALVLGALSLGIVSAQQAAQSVVMRWIMYRADSMVRLLP